EHSALTGKFYFTKLSPPDISKEERETSELFTSDDLQRLKVLADLKRLPLPAFTIRKPPLSLADNIRRFIGVWISDKGIEGSGRQYGLIIEDVSEKGNVFGYRLVGPPASKSTILTPAAYYPFISAIIDGRLVVKGRSVTTVFAFDGPASLT